MSVNLLTQAIEGKWAILPKSLEAISEIIQDHDRIFSRDHFHGSSEENSIQAVIGTMGKRIEGTRFSKQVGSVGILTIDGPIIPRISNSISGPVASLEAYAADLEAMDVDKSINNIVISFDSPGGYVTGVAEFAEYVRSLETKTTGFVYGYAASAAYWIASSVDELYGSKTSEVGSIGTVALFEDRSKKMEKEGVKRFEIVSNLSPNKRLSPETEEGKKEVIKILDQITTEFISDVATGRGVTSDKVMEDFGQGKMFLASEAKELGMIDGISTLSELVQTLNNNQIITEGLMSNENGTDSKVMTASEFKDHNPSAHEEIHSAGYSAGVVSEQGRLKDIEALKEYHPEASKFIDENKFSEGMDQGKMSTEILKNKKKIFEDAASSVVSEGQQLTNELDDIPAAQDEESSEETKELDEQAIIDQMTASAGSIHQRTYGSEMETK